MNSFLGLHKDHWDKGFMHTGILLCWCVLIGGPLYIFFILDVVVEGIISAVLLPTIVYIFALIARYKERVIDKYKERVVGR